MDCCIPGDVVTVSGIVKSRRVEIRSSARTKNKALYVLYVDVNAVSNGNENENGKLDIEEFSTNDLKGIRAVATCPEVQRE